MNLSSVDIYDEESAALWQESPEWLKSDWIKYTTDQFLKQRALFMKDRHNNPDPEATRWYPPATFAAWVRGQEFF